MYQLNYKTIKSIPQLLPSYFLLLRKKLLHINHSRNIIGSLWILSGIYFVLNLCQGHIITANPTETLHYNLLLPILFKSIVKKWIRSKTEIILPTSVLVVTVQNNAGTLYTSMNACNFIGRLCKSCNVAQVQKRSIKHKSRWQHLKNNNSLLMALKMLKKNCNKWLINSQYAANKHVSKKLHKRKVFVNTEVHITK